MSNTNHDPPPAELLADDAPMTLAELCRCCAVEAERIEALVEYGIIEPAGRRGHHLVFQASSLRRVRITLSLERDLGVNPAGAALALDLLERIDALEARLRAMGANR